MRIVAVSDTHTYGPKLHVPDGDVLIHCGDHTFRGTESEMIAAFKWLESLPHERKLIIAGNHDFYLDPAVTDGHAFRSWLIRRRKYSTVEEFIAAYPSLTYLCDNAVEIEGVKFYGSPWQPWYWNWAFNFPGIMHSWNQHAPPIHDRETARAKWAEIPSDVEVLITHTPPKGVLDQADDSTKFGCPELRSRLNDLPGLRLHLFGHIHESYGQKEYNVNGRDVTFVNAAICDIDYNPKALHEPAVIDL